MPGRKPLGPQLAQHLDGSNGAKERLEVILETIAGRLPVAQACARLGISEAMFHRLRTEVLQAGLSRLEPRPLGRPPRAAVPEALRVAELEHDLQDLQLELKTTRVQLEIAQTLPHLLPPTTDESRPERTLPSDVKKTNLPPKPR
jgi:hypothetical protein